MQGIQSLFILFLVGTVGCVAFKAVRIPLPALLGSIAATAALAITGRYPDAPVSAVSSICKIIMGMVMGRRLNRNSLMLLRRMMMPALLVSAWMVILSISGGYFFSWMSDLPLSTSLIGSSMGGVNEMAIFALSLNLDVATITIISVTRLVSALVITPWIARKWAARLRERGAGAYRERARGEFKESPSLPRAGVVCMAALSVAGGVAFDAAGIPAGFMIGALCASGAFTLISGRGYCIHPKLIVAAQIGLGIAIAREFGPEQIGYLTNPKFLCSLVVCNTLTNGANLLLAVILQRTTGWSPITCLLSTCAGGLSQMVVVAEEMDGDPLTIGLLHLARYLAIIFCMPFIITMVLSR
jgi:membrane AbrB-like protein